MDPYQWRESVLSTRSLSYLSTADALAPPTHSSRNPSNAYGRRSTMDSESNYGDDLEMADAEGDTSLSRRDETSLSDIHELPESVARSPLFTLPREIRDRIYTFCLTAAENLPVEWPHLPLANLRYGLQPQLLRTCKPIYTETGLLLYTLNTLTFHHPSDANMLVRALANPTLSRQHITNLSLHIKHTDTRLWMPYFTTTDPHRSLKADFPSLRDLGIRYRSNKWNHSLSPDANLRNCLDDTRLDEIIDSLRGIYFPPAPPQPPFSSTRGEPEHECVKPLNEMNEWEFMRFVDARRPGEDMAFKRQLLELHKAHAPQACARPDPPRVKVICACRVHSAHFNLLTSSTEGGLQQGAQQQQQGIPPPPPPPPPAHHGHGHGHGPLGPIAALLPNLTGGATASAPESPVAASPTAVKEGEAFRGFTAVDFSAANVRKLHDPDLGSAKVARTVFAERKGVLLGLEIHCLDSASRRE
ncbi:hypothetical protein LTR86_006307 [Recurvomyces mirabilis]|nr:hypothetical protein LTR86_006307 [Recurvomyces mirabilis]